MSVEFILGFVGFVMTMFGMGSFLFFGVVRRFFGFLDGFNFVKLM